MSKRSVLRALRFFSGKERKSQGMVRVGNNIFLHTQPVCQQVACGKMADVPLIIRTVARPKCNCRADQRVKLLGGAVSAVVRNLNHVAFQILSVHRADHIGSVRLNIPQPKHGLSRNSHSERHGGIIVQRQLFGIQIRLCEQNLQLHVAHRPFHPRVRLDVPNATCRKGRF